MAHHEDLYEVFQANKESQVRIFLITGREIAGTVGSASRELVALEGKNEETWFVVYEHIIAILFDKKAASSPKMGYR
jgi:hypothetical protein